MQAQLYQRGRAATDFLASLASLGTSLSPRIGEDLATANLREEQLPDDYQGYSKVVLSALENSKAFQLEALVREWLSTNHGPIAISAFEEIRLEVESQLAELRLGGCTLIVNPDCHIPSYWSDFDIHRTIGGWNGHPHMGFIHREIIHKRYVAAKYPWQIQRQRREVLDELPPSKEYQQIFEMGCGTGHYTSALAERFPDATLSACDLSVPLLEEAQRLGNENGWRWNLFQAPAEDTGLDESSFDLVTSYVLLHEMPANAIVDTFSESFRLLKPGGVVMMIDARLASDMDKLTQWRAFHNAEFGGEPFWRESVSQDLGGILETLGYADVKSYGLGEARYPWVTMGVKP